MDEKKVSEELLRVGFISYSEQDTAIDIIRRCTKLGIPLAGVGALVGGQTATVVLPGIGTVSGALVGALIGLASGTSMCVALNYSARNELKSLVHEQRNK